MPTNEANDHFVPNTAEKNDQVNHVLCATCEHDVPLSEAVVPEATDYVVYFCGLDCYERWRTQANG